MNKNKKIVIVGLSNNAKLAAFYFNRDTDYEVVAFAVNREFKNTNEFQGLPVVELETLLELYSPEKYSAFVAVGYNKMNAVRQSLYNQVKELGFSLPNYISPKCSFLTEEQIGDNNFILEDNTIQPFVKIGSNNVLWSGNHIGHDVEIGDHNFITSHVVVSGFTKIENNTFIGVNATLRDGIAIANKTLIAAGAIIMKNTSEGDVWAPAKSTLFSKKSDEIQIS
jgi:sugar O-acyltransferase (sialic acid O-acetyltransferase NeuD family)